MPEMTAPMLGAVELACQRYAEMVDEAFDTKR